MSQDCNFVRQSNLTKYFVLLNQIFLYRYYYINSVCLMIQTIITVMMAVCRYSEIEVNHRRHAKDTEQFTKNIFISDKTINFFYTF